MRQYLCILLFILINSICCQNNACTDTVQNDDGYCWCNLSDYCDVSCCCDFDCSAADLSAFATCDNLYNLNGSCTCFRPGIFIRNSSANWIGNVDSYAVVNTSCIFHDSYSKIIRSRNYYVPPQPLCSMPSPVSDSISYSTDPASTSYSRYRSGSRILVVHANDDQTSTTEAVGFLPLPKSVGNSISGDLSECADNNAASFLVNQAWQCDRTVLDTEAACSNLTALNARSYYLNKFIVPDPSSVSWVAATDDAALTFPQMIPITVTENVNVTSDCMESGRNPLSPSFVSDASGNSFCSCVVRQVSYLIVTRLDGVIQSASVSFAFDNLQADPSRFQQSFSINFAYSDNPSSSNVFRQSGSPGYATGSTVLALYNRDLYNSPYDQLLNSPDCVQPGNSICPLRIFGAVTSSDCSVCLTDPTRCISPVYFGLNYRSGCTFTVNRDNFGSTCTLLKSQAAFLLSGLPYSAGANDSNLASYAPRFGVFGTVGQSVDAENWQPAVSYAAAASDRSTETIRSSSYVCDSVTRSVTMEVAYVKTGSLSSPQPAIVGIAYRLGARERLVYNPDAYQNDQLIELSSAVVFVDMSSTNSPSASKSKPRLPPISSSGWSDFFYLFYVESYGNFYSSRSSCLATPFVSVFASVFTVVFMLQYS